MYYKFEQPILLKGKVLNSTYRIGNNKLVDNMQYGLYKAMGLGVIPYTSRLERR